MKLKSILLGYLIAFLILWPFQSWATDYYAQKGSCNLNSVSSGTTSDVWNTNPAGGGTWYHWTTDFSDGITTGDNFYANANTAIAINVSPGQAGKIPTLRTDAGSGTTGGGFTLNTSLNTSIYANYQSGSSHCVALSGTTGGLTLEGSSIVGGESGTSYGVYDTHSTVTVTVNHTTITAGSSSGGIGYAHTGGTSGVLTFSGTCIAASTYGCSTSTSGVAVTWNNCTGGTTAGAFGGCYASGAAGATVIGNITNGTHSVGVIGRIKRSPTNAQKYTKYDGGGTAIYESAGLGSDSAGTQIAASSTAANIKSGTYFVKKDDGVFTVGTAELGSSGGGGAWGF